MLKLNTLFSERLTISHNALKMYPVKLMGQNIEEVGGGSVLELRPEYFFLDDSYVRILLKYGLFLFIIALAIMIIISKRAGQIKQFVIVLALVAISIHSIMEHRLIDMAYNPMILALFASLMREKQNDRRKTCIEETVEVG